ncbi:MAG: hypothetical protein QM613_03215 [Micrococcaceae bacterium]
MTSPHMQQQPRQQFSKSEIYRRRRFLVTVLTVGIVSLLLLSIIKVIERSKAKDAAQDQAQSVVTLTAADSQQAQATDDDSGEVASTCNSDDIKVSAATDRDVYSAGMEPKLTMNIENKGKKSCMLNVGTSQQTFIIKKKGGQQIWSSKDCQDGATNTELLIGNGKSDSAIMDWARVLSAAGCKEPDGMPQPGEYELVVQLGTIPKSDPAEFILQ